MRLLAIAIVTVGLASCAAPTPHLVFQQATEAFADGSIEKGTAHFSSRLKEARRIQDLERYYADEKRRKGVKYLLEGHQFQLTSQDGDRAVGEVTWRNGRREPVYFVLEKGSWKLDLPPTSVKPANAVTVDDFDQAKADLESSR